MKFSAEIVLNAIEDAFESMFELLMPVDLNDDIQPTKAKAKGDEWETFEEDTIAQEKLKAYEEMLMDGAAGGEVAQALEGTLNEGMRLLSTEVGDEADATCIAL
jgi:hypothetical protein